MVTEISNRTVSAAADTDDKWFNSRVTWHRKSLADIRQFIPTFERQPFTLPEAPGVNLRSNVRLDSIVRCPIGDDKTTIPVGVVSKNYALIQHTDVIEQAEQALKAARIDSSKVDAELCITEYGERMALSLFLPKEYEFDPGDGHPMALRLELTNSVEGSTRFRGLMGWFRFVCSNGLIIGVTQSDIRRRHAGEMRINDIADVLFSGISDSDRDKRNFENWRKTSVPWDRIGRWCDSSLLKTWGFKAAARTFHIAGSGTDVQIAGTYKGTSPSTIDVSPVRKVPGTPSFCGNLYDISQVLAWLAKERRDIQEQLEWREQIPDLLKSLHAA